MGTNSVAIDADALERKKMVANSRRSNFNIGEEAKIQREKYAVDTSSKAAYKGDLLSLKSKSIDKGIMDFKRANFKFGNSRSKWF